MQPRRAIALFAALALMAVIGLLVAGAVASSTIAQRSARLAHTDALLTMGGDYALGTVVADPARYGLADLEFGRAAALDVALPDAAGPHAVVTATRLRNGTVWLVAEVALSGLDTGRRRTNLVLQYPTIGPLPSAGIVARGSVRLGRDVRFVPDSATDPECSQLPAADVIVAPGAVVTGESGARAMVSPAARDSIAYFLTAGQLAALGSRGQVVRVRGDTVISGGSFTGILVVDGSLDITGPFTAVGLIVASGQIRALSGPIVVTGAILSFALPAGSGAAIDLADATVQHSPCRIAQMLRRGLGPRAARARGWAELF